MEILTSDDVMPVGKYKGMKVSKIMKHDPSWLKTFDNNKVALSDSVFDQLGGGLRLRGQKLSYTRSKGISNNGGIVKDTIVLRF